jgi:ABC-type polysaccharide/polyol phosphate transport system ATPase subunit
VSSSAIEVVDLAKSFKLFHDRNTTLKATLMRGGRRARYEQFWALEDVTLEVPRGTLFGLIGSNGSGKSTLLKCMAGILRPDRGSVRLDGRASALLELGAGFHPELSGRENVFLNGSILGMSTRQMKDRFDDIVSFAGLERFIDQPVKNYSSGMFVRLGFSVAINVEPDILLVDEVMAVGDESFQQRCTEKFAELRAAGRTIVVVSHGMEGIRNLCDEVAWLAEGHLQAVGPASDVIDAYLRSVREAASHEPGAAPTAGLTRLDLQLLDETGEQSRSITAGGEATVRTRFTVEHIDEPVEVEIDIHRTDGIHLARSTTSPLPLDHSVPGGIATVDYTIPALPLLPGVFVFSVLVRGHSSSKVHARAERCLKFEVAPGSGEERAGMVALGGGWTAREGVGAP